MFPPNNFGCFQWLPTVAYESAGFCLVLSCLLHCSMPAFLWSLCSALDTAEALNTPLSLIQVRPEKQWGEHCTVSFGVFFVELVMRQCYYCRHSCFMSIALKLLFFIQRDQMCNFETYSLRDCSYVMNGSAACAISHRSEAWVCSFFCISSSAWWNLSSILVLNTIPTLTTLKLISLTNISI